MYIRARRLDWLEFQSGLAVVDYLLVELGGFFEIGLQFNRVLNYKSADNTVK